MAGHSAPELGYSRGFGRFARYECRDSGQVSLNYFEYIFLSSLIRSVISESSRPTSFMNAQTS